MKALIAMSGGVDSSAAVVLYDGDIVLGGGTIQ